MNILLQHWQGDMSELAAKSIQCMKAYAHSVGAEYQLLRGEVFLDDVSIDGSPIQKMAMLDESFDEYDVVVMTDCDMFTRDGDNLLNIFTDELGVGDHSMQQPRLSRELKHKYPALFDLKYSYWGGSTKRMDRDLRIKLRSVLNMDEARMFATRTNHCDEGFMFRLATLAKIKGRYFPDIRWQYPNFWPDVGTDKAQFIHIRKKQMVNGKLTKGIPKIDNYNTLVKDGVIRDWTGVKV